MNLSLDIESMGFRLADINEADINDFLQVHILVNKKYVVEHKAFLGEWNDENVYIDFNCKMHSTYFKKVLLYDETVGFLGYNQTEIQIDDISIQMIEKAQNKGIGSTFLLYLIQLSAEINKPLCLKVIKTNPAQNLYIRLGFEVYSETEVFYYMRYIPLEASA